MDGLLSFLLFAGVFYLMMRYGCGAHMIHGHSHGHSQGNHVAKFIDPVCGMEVKADEGYGKMHEGVPYRFCTRNCLDKFDQNPAQYLKNDHSGEIS